MRVMYFMPADVHIAVKTAEWGVAGFDAAFDIPFRTRPNAAIRMRMRPNTSLL